MHIYMYNIYISTTPARLHHHPTPPHPTDPTRYTKDGRTPIFIAAREGKTDAVKELIAAGCDINLANKVKQMTRLALALALRAFRARLPLAPLATLNLQYLFRLLLEA
jgi:ankyrin repeat protein